ncbi:hypothetical protein [Occallatibacter savannae]|uniref:hypothetical protein n=1 Tax=Occallatibacter savannae TaxID=1002691 RepID=UPI0013A56E15|nr:hypothetical protein [Occallatibacter savannae]
MKPAMKFDLRQRELSASAGWRMAQHYLQKTQKVVNESREALQRSESVLRWCHEYGPPVDRIGQVEYTRQAAAGNGMQSLDGGQGRD